MKNCPFNLLQEAKSDMSQLAKKFEKQMIPSGPGKVVDIKKYLAQTQDNPKVALKNGVSPFNILF